MTNTTNYSLKKPAYEDGADVEALNFNADIIDGELKKAEAHRNIGEIHTTQAEKDTINATLKQINNLAANAIPASEKGITIASLENGKVPTAQLPVMGGSVYQAAAPSNTSLIWLDSTAGGAAKYYNGTAWVNVPAVWG